MAIQNFCLLLASVLVQPQNWMITGHRAMDEGRAQDAAVAFQRALDEGRRMALPNEELIHIRVALATAFMEAQNIRAADAVLREANSDDPMTRAELLNARGSLHLIENRVSEAAAELSEARQLLGKIPDPGGLAASVLHNLSGAELREGLYTEALGHAEQALKLMEKTLPPDHPNLIRVRGSMGALEYLTGQPRRAQATMEIAIASAERAFGVAHPLIADLLDSDVVILERLHKKKEARAARERAKLIRGGSGEPAPRRMTWDVREALVAGEIVTK